MLRNTREATPSDAGGRPESQLDRGPPDARRWPQAQSPWGEGSWKKTTRWEEHTEHKSGEQPTMRVAPIRWAAPLARAAGDHFLKGFIPRKHMTGNRANTCCGHKIYNPDAADKSRALRTQIRTLNKDAISDPSQSVLGPSGLRLARFGQTSSCVRPITSLAMAVAPARPARAEIIQLPESCRGFSPGRYRRASKLCQRCPNECSGRRDSTRIRGILAHA